jgi:hypothetical protein
MNIEQASGLTEESALLPTLFKIIRADLAKYFAAKKTFGPFVKETVFCRFHPNETNVSYHFFGVKIL